MYQCDREQIVDAVAMGDNWTEQTTELKLCKIR